MTLRLLLASAFSLAVIPSGYAQVVDLKAFPPASDSQQPFPLQVAGAGNRESQPKPDALGGLVNEFAAFGTENTLTQADTTVHRRKKMAMGTTPASVPSLSIGVQK
jgi:hypothetical protein